MSDHTEEIAQLVRAGRVVARRMDADKAELEEIKRRIRKLVAVGETLDVDGARVALQPNRAFDLDAAVALLTPEQRATCLAAPSYDAKKVKAQLPPVLLDQCMAERGEPKVVGLA